jgi:nucleoside-diphosphate-sugar epimerase
MKKQMIEDDYIIDRRDPILITGANGFIGSRVAETLLRYGFKSLRCFVRPSSNLATLKSLIESTDNDGKLNIVQGNLLSRDDCKEATKDVSLVYHLAAATAEKSLSGAFMNSVVTTRNLLDAILESGSLKRFVIVSSFTVYSNSKMKPGALLDETCEVENEPQLRGEAYCYGKVKQEELLHEYGKKYDIPHVILRPGAVYGPGRKAITGRVGIDKFGIFLHLGGSNRLPLTYVDNCADAIVLAGLKKGVEGEVFNIVDDEILTSRAFLKMYKERVKSFKSIYIPKKVSYLFCYLWEKCSMWSGGKLSLAFNRKRWSAEWRGNRYSNDKLKILLGWKPRVSPEEGLKRYFEYCRKAGEFND